MAPPAAEIIASGSDKNEPAEGFAAIRGSGEKLAGGQQRESAWIFPRCDAPRRNPARNFTEEAAYTHIEAVIVKEKNVGCSGDRQKIRDSLLPF